MKKFSLLVLVMLLTSFVSVGAVSAQQVVVKAPGWYAASYEVSFFDVEGEILANAYGSGYLTAGVHDHKVTIPSSAATFTFYGGACGGGSHTFSDIKIGETSGDAVFDFCGLLGSTARIEYNIFGSKGEVSMNAGHK